jgi:very-short-patch-repair endonuclease
MADQNQVVLPKVQGVHPTVATELAQSGVITVAAHPELRSTLSRLRQAGVLTNPLPGVYLSAANDSRLGWLRAVTAWSSPHGALHGRSAAGLWLPDVDGPVAFLAHPWLRSRRGISMSRRTIPAEFVHENAGIRFASPAYAAVELAGSDDGRAICECLRQKLADRDALELALSALTGADGNNARRGVVTACAGNPWSYAELKLHRILVAAGITGWVANRPLRVGSVVLRPDVRFRRVQLVLEFDGRESHGNSEQFISDRERQNLLEAAGYRVLRFGWEHLSQPDYIVDLVRRALRAP